MRLFQTILAALLCLTGLVLGVGGAQLMLLGGSSYYLLAGGTVLIAGALLLRRRRLGLWVYGAALVGTLGWTVAETGLDGWAMVPRMVGPVLVGALLLIAFRGRDLVAAPYKGGWRALALGGAGALAVGFALFQLTPRPADPVYQAGQQDSITAISAAHSGTEADGEWPVWGRDAAGSRFSPAAQITPGNVADLKPAWTYHTGMVPNGVAFNMAVTPIKVKDRLYLCTPTNDIVALDAETGRQVWRHNVNNNIADVALVHCRGVAYHETSATPGLCAARIYTNTTDARLIAVDAATGQTCPGFGKNGVVSLLDGMGQVTKGYYYVTSAPTIVRGKIILGGWITDGQYWGEPSGVIRAFDAVTGALSWAFDMGQPDRIGAPAPGETYTRATPNAWAPMSVDAELGLVYAPTGNATPDYYGPHRRPFDDKYASSVIALDAETGRPRWTFQTVHRDLWDYDVASQPTLLDLPGKDGGVIKALVQPTKRGDLFLLDRVTGAPLADVVEKRVPQKGAPAEERLSPTQPFSVGMPSLAGPELREADMWGISPFDQLWCRIKFREARYEGMFTPLGETPMIMFPGYLGGSNWGSATYDPQRGLLIAPSNRMGNYNRLMPRAEADKKGIKPREPGSTAYVGGAVAQAGTPYAADIKPFLSPIGVPCQRPPYGFLTAIDMKTKRVVWHRAIGTAEGSGPMGLKSGLPLPMGAPIVGGAITTGGGLTFVAGTQDERFRAFDSSTGHELWSVKLPAGGQATPMTYISPKGRQMVVIAAGGNAILTGRPGDSIIAYALPENDGKN